MAGAFKFGEPGSRVLREWGEEQRMKRALAQRSQAHQKKSFAGAGINRLTFSLATSSRAVNADLDNSLAILRSRARSLCANYEYGRRFLSLVANNVVGASGPALQVRKKTSNGKDLDREANEALETHWARWSDVCDIRGQLALAELLRVVVKAAARDGEALVRVVRNKALPYGMALQLLEADRLDENLNKRLDNGNIIRMGVELNSALRPVAYWMLTIHPGENFSVGSRNWERVLARDLYHLYLTERPEQARGYSWTHAVLLRASHLQGFDEAAVVAARIGASKTGVLKRVKDPTSDDAIKRMADAQDATTGALQMSAEPGEFIDLPPGYDFESFNPDYPHALYGDFVRSCLRGIAAGLDVDYASLSNDRSSENYSSIRHGALETREVWMALQQWFIRSLVKPVFVDWLASGLVSGEITWLNSGKPMKPELLQVFSEAAKFQGRRWPWVDPKNDAEAARLLIEAGLESRTNTAAGQGRDFIDIRDELAQEKKLLEEAGLPTTVDNTNSGQIVTAAPAAGAGDGGKALESALGALTRAHELFSECMGKALSAIAEVGKAPTHVDARTTIAEGAVQADFKSGDTHLHEASDTINIETPAAQVIGPTRSSETIRRSDDKEIVGREITHHYDK